ncbi:MAG: 6,7-dimethyl-8-ribityllumazine synthase [Actinomycetaceae bacterium]|nr:6,7-dimethyl-8-ribityllumazine synthase [Actinomycetaceae bacterium]
MAGSGAPEMGVKKVRGARIGVVASRWHDTVMDGLIDGASRAIKAAGAKGYLYRVPGSFELPLGAAKALARKDIDAVVALGVVIRGATPHFDYVCDAATQGLLRASLDAKKPVGFGLLTCDNEQQALDRAGVEDSCEDKGFEAAAAAIEMIALEGKRLKLKR